MTRPSPQRVHPNDAALDLMKREARSRRLKLMMLTVGLGVGGTEGQVLEIASRLDRSRYDVTVCALKGDNVIAQELRARGVRVFTLGGRGKIDWRVVVKLWQLVRKERPDVIHAFLLWANLISRVVGKLLQVPVLISSYRAINAWKGWPLILADRLTARWVHRVTCCSDAVRRIALIRLGGEAKKYITIHNGVDLARFMDHTSLKKQDLGLHEHLPVIGTVGRLDEPDKGLSVLLQAIASLLGGTSSPCCQLLIVGEGPALGQLHGLSDRLGIAPWVVFAGMRRDIADVLPLIDVFALASNSEGFGIAIVEAMASGRPVVATAVGGIPEIVVPGETGLLVPPGDPIALARALQDLLNDSGRAKSFGARGRQRARERFSIETVVRRHAELYDACWNRRGGSVSQRWERSMDEMAVGGR